MKLASRVPKNRLAVGWFLLAICLATLVSSSAYAQESRESHPNFYFRRLQVEDGLSQNTVYAILQDSQGYLWFGTQDGLNRYDGRYFKVFKRNNRDSTSIGNNTITAIAEDREGNLWVGTGDGAYVYDYRSESFYRYAVRSDEGAQVTGMVRDIQVDAQGNVWMAVFNKGVFRASPDGQLTYYNLEQGENPAPIWIRRIAFDTAGNVWIGTYREGMYCLDVADGTLTQYLIQRNSATGDDNDVNDIVLLDAENLLVGTSNRGVQQFNLRTRKFTPLLERDGKDKPLYVRRLIQSQNGELWIGTESGLFIYHLPSRQFENLRHISGDHFSVTDNAIHSVYQDREGGMWLGTYFGGINYYIKSYSLFEKYYPSPQANSLQGKSISEFSEVADGTIWIGTEDAGLHAFNPNTQQFSHGHLPATNIHALMQDEGNLWVGSFTEGLFILDLQTKRFKQYKNGPAAGSLINNNIYSIYKDYTGTIWVGTMMGLCRFDRATETFEPVQSTEITTQVNDIVEDRWGVLWVATIGGGIYAYERNTDTWRHYPVPVPSDASSGRVTCLLIDQQQRLWAGTEGAGLFQYDRVQGVFENVRSEDNGLPNNVIYRLVEDLNGHIWGSTNKGLFKLDIKSDSISIFTHANGLLGDQFNYKSGFRSQSGKLYFGGIKGFVAFAPYTMWVNDVPPPVVINSVQFSNTELVGISELELPPNISVFSISFAALSYVSPLRNQYAYMLEGKDKDWIVADGQSKVTYSNLAPGNYIFRVKASNSDGVWNEQGARLAIDVLPPFYRTGWAYAFYLLFLLLGTFWATRYLVQRVRTRNRGILQAISLRKEEELYNTKIEFFTNITHELRTPLSLIKAPLEEIMKQTLPSNPHWENLAIMERNTNRLLKLVNELLDFRKAESRGVAVQFANIDLVLVIANTVKRFQSTARLNNVVIDIQLPEKPVYIDLDVEIFTKILTNLVHNGLKHASERVVVSFATMQGYVKLFVQNDGPPIDQEMAERIFLPFFKLDEKSPGSGLGLAFSKSLAELHKGNLYLGESDSNTVFVLELPLRQECHQRCDEPTEYIGWESQQRQEIGDVFKIDNRNTILMVEDNAEFRQFLASQLQDAYQLLTAKDGQEAITLLEEKHVDVIISDIMMPVMDGITLCKLVKENLKYSHIPVILLTAKTGLHSKIEGLKVGADEYIDKPYSIDFLRARVENLLENRRKIKEAYHTLPETAYDSIAHSKADHDFLERLVETIHAHLDQLDLDVDKLANALNMSRATFYRKIKHISELTPNEFIRLVRLKKAAELLRAKDYRVSEIAYLVGFSSPSYFTKCFQQQFGVLPKDFERAITSSSNKQL